MLQWTKGCIYVFKLVFLFSLDRYPEVALLIGWGSVFNLLRLICTVFHSGCINLYLHQQCTSVFSASLETITFFFYIMIILTTVRWYIIVVLICMFLIISDVEHLFICLFDVCMYGFSLVQFSHSAMSNSLQPHGLQHTRPPCTL